MANRELLFGYRTSFLFFNISNRPYGHCVIRFSISLASNDLKLVTLLPEGPRGGVLGLVRMVASLMNCSTEAFILGVILPHPPPSEAVFDFETISVHFRVVTRSPTWSFSSDRNVLE